MHIVIFTDHHDSTVSGVATSIRSQRKALEKLGHKVTIVSPPPAKGQDGTGAIIVPKFRMIKVEGFALSAATARNLKLIEHELIKRGSIDVIHVQTNFGIGVMGVKIAKKWHLPLVQTMHGRDDTIANTSYPIPAVTTSLLRMLHEAALPPKLRLPNMHEGLVSYNAWSVMVNHAQMADYVITPSLHFLERLRTHGMTRPASALSNGIDDDMLGGLPQRSYVAPNPGGPLRVIWCGRLSHEKRLIEAIDAVAKVDGCKMDIYGVGVLEDTVRDHIAARNLSSRVTMHGYVDQKVVLEQMQAHDVLLYSSFGFDTQAIVLLEAVAAGTPIIYCDPDLAESMPAGAGLLTDTKSVASMAKALIAVRDNPDLLLEKANILRDKRFTVAQSFYTKQAVDIYKQVIKRKGKDSRVV